MVRARASRSGVPPPHAAVKEPTGNRLQPVDSRQLVEAEFGQPPVHLLLLALKRNKEQVTLPFKSSGSERSVSPSSKRAVEVLRPDLFELPDGQARGRSESRLQQAAIRAHAVGLATLQGSLRPDEMILEYVLDEPSSFCFHVTSSSVAVNVLPAGQKRIEDLVDRYLAEIRSSKTGAETGANLYSLLVQPVPGEESKTRLIVVPDGRLHLLPFGCLADLKGRYLLESHVVTLRPFRNRPLPH